MTEEKIVEEAFRYWTSGNNNCAQAVASGVLDYFGFEEESKTLNKAFLPYGGGIGERTICGSLVGALGALSFLLKENSVESEKMYEKFKILKQKFSEVNGSLRCRELLQDFINTEGKLERDNPERKKVCDMTVETAVIITRNLVEENES